MSKNKNDVVTEKLIFAYQNADNVWHIKELLVSINNSGHYEVEHDNFPILNFTCSFFPKQFLPTMIISVFLSDKFGVDTINFDTLKFLSLPTFFAPKESAVPNG